MNINTEITIKPIEGGAQRLCKCCAKPATHVVYMVILGATDATFRLCGGHAAKLRERAKT